MKRFAAALAFIVAATLGLAIPAYANTWAVGGYKSCGIKIAYTQATFTGFLTYITPPGGSSYGYIGGSGYITRSRDGNYSGNWAVESASYSSSYDISSAFASCRNYG